MIALARRLWPAGLLLITACATPPQGTPGLNPAPPAPSPARAVPSPPAPAPLPPRPPAGSTPAPVLAPQVADEAELQKQIDGRLARADRIAGRVDPAKLGQDQREMLSSLEEFVAKAKEALARKDLPRADVLSDKAQKLADELESAATAK